MISANIKREDGSYIKSYSINRKNIWTKSGLVWNNMMNRCNPNNVAHKDNYLDCCVGEDFRDFNFFANWHENQVGFDLENYELDKDLIEPGNKIYTAEKCVILPSKLNSFVFNKRPPRGNLLHGVSKHPLSNKFKAQITIENKVVHLGLFNNPNQAYEVFKEAKNKELNRWIARLEAGEFLVDPKVIEALKAWTFN